jgi:hypothetical protein
MRSDVNNPSFVWGALRKVLPQGATDGTDNVRGLRLTADGHGAVFDIKEVSALSSFTLARMPSSSLSPPWLELPLPCMRGGGGGARMPSPLFSLPHPRLTRRPPPPPPVHSLSSWNRSPRCSTLTNGSPWSMISPSSPHPRTAAARASGRAAARGEARAATRGAAETGAILGARGAAGGAAGAAGAAAAAGEAAPRAAGGAADLGEAGAGATGMGAAVAGGETREMQFRSSSSIGHFKAYLLKS